MTESFEHHINQGNQKAELSCINQFDRDKRENLQLFRV